MLQTLFDSRKLPPGQQYPVICLAFSPNSRTLAGGSWNNIVRFWDTRTKRQINEWKNVSLSYRSDSTRVPAGALSTLNYSPDGSLLAIGSFRNSNFSERGDVVVFATTTGQRLWSVPAHASEIRDVKFSPDGKILASSSDDGTVRLWKVSSGENLRILRLPQQSGYANVLSVAWSFDNKKLAAFDLNGQLYVWDSQTGKIVIKQHPSGIAGIAFEGNSYTLRIVTRIDWNNGLLQTALLKLQH